MHKINCENYYSFFPREYEYPLITSEGYEYSLAVVTGTGNINEPIPLKLGYNAVLQIAALRIVTQTHAQERAQQAPKAMHYF